jgi:hypothetical protein
MTHNFRCAECERTITASEDAPVTVHPDGSGRRICNRCDETFNRCQGIGVWWTVVD